MSTPLRPDMMQRLAFLRLLHIEANQQARRPEPLAAIAVLLLHDAVEQFLILAAEHVRDVSIRRGGNHDQYFEALNERGIELRGRIWARRLSDVRNVLKHTGTLPAASAIEDARAGAASFFEENTPLVFAMHYDSIDMADVVPQERTRERLRAAAAAESAGDRTQAMGELAQAFRELFSEQVGAGFTTGRYGFGTTIRNDPMFASSIGGIFQAIASLAKNNSGTIASTGRKLGQRFGELIRAVTEMQAGMRVLALGIDYARYLRFLNLTPSVMYDGQLHVTARSGYAPNQAEYDECRLFVITSGLRLAEVDAAAAAPSWMPQPA